MCKKIVRWVYDKKTEQTDYPSIYLTLFEIFVVKRGKIQPDEKNHLTVKVLRDRTLLKMGPLNAN